MLKLPFLIERQGQIAGADHCGTTGSPKLHDALHQCLRGQLGFPNGGDEPLGAVLVAPALHLLGRIIPGLLVTIHSDDDARRWQVFLSIVRPQSGDALPDDLCVSDVQGVVVAEQVGAMQRDVLTVGDHLAQPRTI